MTYSRRKRIPTEEEGCKNKRQLYTNNWGSFNANMPFEKRM
jgi:hypothetical protein